MDRHNENQASIHAFANACYSVRDASGDAAYLRSVPIDGDGEPGNDFTATDPAAASAFYFKPSRLGAYLLYDQDGRYLFSEGGDITRREKLISDFELLDDDFQSGAEWDLLNSDDDSSTFLLRHRKTGRYLTAMAGLAEREQAARLFIEEAIGCRPHPEEGVHATGRVERVTFDDGDLFGIADVHEHVVMNWAFGGAGIFHGAAFHPLGVEHALPDCERYHGAEGRSDIAGFAFDTSGSGVSVASLIPAIFSGRLNEFNHYTAGWPEFPDWPAYDRASHQQSYYKWLERAYLSGLRLLVQHASGNQILCDLIGGSGVQPIRYSCNDMVSVDRQVTEAWRMQDYIDAQEGGPGEGWFRIVTSPEEAREVILDGKMAVVLGIEISNIFDCYLTPPAPLRRCTEEDVEARLDEYYDRGVRVIFPVHKYDNAFSAGDGQKGIMELANILQTGHYSSFGAPCDEDVPGGFDNGGDIVFPGANRPREDYFAEPPFDLTNLFDDPFRMLLPILPDLIASAPAQRGVCKNHGLTELGEFLIGAILRRGMIPDMAHLPRTSYKRVYEILAENDYPGTDTHGRDNNGQLYELGGMSQSGFGRCRNPNVPATTDDGFQQKLARVIEKGGYPAVPLGFDRNGFAGAQGPRFGPQGCNSEQVDPVTYPFPSYAGDVMFQQPMVGNRVLDWNTEGFAHIGLLPEMIQDVRADGVTDAELEPLFRSAEGYIRMWEKAERRSVEIRAADG